MIGRRHLLKLTAGAGVAAFGMAGRGLFLPWFDIGRAAEGEELIEPEVRASKDGLLDTTLEASVMSVPVAGGTAIMSVYEGTFPGPTLRVRPGDTLRINLVNKLDDLPAGLPADSPFLWVPMGEDGDDDERHEPPHARIARLPLRQLRQHLHPRHGRRELPVRVQDPGQPSVRSLLVSPAPARHLAPTRSSAAWSVRSSSRGTSTTCPASTGSPSACWCSRRRSSTPDGRTASSPRKTASAEGLPAPGQWPAESRR